MLSASRKLKVDDFVKVFLLPASGVAARDGRRGKAGREAGQK